MGDINLKLDADQYALVSGVLKADDAVKQLIKNTTKLGVAGARSGKKLNDGFKGFMKTAASIAGGMGMAAGIQRIGGAVIAQIKREIAHLQQAQGRSAVTQMTFGQTRSAMLLNLSDPGKESAKLDRIVSDLSKGKYQAKRTDIMAAMGGPLSGRGALSLDQMKGSVKLALLIEGLAGAAAPMGLTAGAIMDVRKLDPRITDKAALGFAMGVGQASRVTEYQKYLAALPPVLASGKAKGFTLKESAVMFAYMTQIGGDTEGTISATGTINFQKALDLSTAEGHGLLPYAAADRKGKLVTKWRTTKKGGMAALREIQGAWADMTPGQRKLLQIKMGGKAKTQGPIGLLLARDREAMAAWDTAWAGIVDPRSASAGKPVDDYLAVAGGGKYEPLRKMDKLFGRTVEELQLQNPYAMAGIIRKGLNNALQDMPGTTDLGNRVAKAMFEINANFGESDKTLEAGLAVLERTQAKSSWTKPFIMRQKTVFGQRVQFADYGDPDKPYERGPTDGERIFTANPKYRPVADKIVEELAEGIRALIEEIRRDRKTPKKVEIVNPDPAGPRAHGE